MDRLIREMPYTDEATKIVLQEIVDKKNKLADQEWRHRLSVLLTCVLTVVTMVHLLFAFINAGNDSLAERYQMLSGDLWLFWFFFSLLFAFLWMKITKGKCDKYDQEFESLRREIVSNSDDFWNEDEAWKNRHQIFQVMKENYDINLFYESK